MDNAAAAGWKRFEHPIAFWFGAAAASAGVVVGIGMIIFGWACRETRGRRLEDVSQVEFAVAARR